MALLPVYAKRRDPTSREKATHLGRLHAGYRILERDIGSRSWPWDDACPISPTSDVSQSIFKPRRIDLSVPDVLT